MPELMADAMLEAAELGAIDFVPTTENLEHHARFIVAELEWHGFDYQAYHWRSIFIEHGLMGV